MPLPPLRGLANAEAEIAAAQQRLAAVQAELTPAREEVYTCPLLCTFICNVLYVCFRDSYVE